MISQAAVSVGIFLIVMILIVSNKIHRTVAAVGGAVLLFPAGIFDIATGASYVDFNTIGVLLGMMLFVAVIKNTGLFEYIAVRAAKLAGGDPWRIMVLFALITAALSSVLDNVTTVLLTGPMTIAITKILQISPVPFIMTQIFASNIGGTATLIGDPPNIMIGSAAGLSFMDFLMNNGPVILLVMAVMLLCFWVLYGRHLTAEKSAAARIMQMNETAFIRDKVLLRKSVFMILFVIVGFVLHNSLGLETAVVAMGAAVLMMVIGRQSIEQTIADVEWPTIVFFIALFILVGGMVETGVIAALADRIVTAAGGREFAAMIAVLWVTALLSSTLDNIPFVAAMIPLIASLENSGMNGEPLWWALSLGSCLGGNGTLIGASANVVLAGISEKNGYPISYMAFLKTGFPLMLLTVIICTVYMTLRYS